MLQDWSTQTGTVRKVSTTTQRMVYYFLGAMSGDASAVSVRDDLDPTNPTLGLFPNILWGIIVRQDTPTVTTSTKYYAYKIINGKQIGGAVELKLKNNAARFSLSLTLPTDYVADTDPTIEWAVERLFTPQVAFAAYSGTSTVLTSGFSLTPETGEDVFIANSVGTAATITFVELEDQLSPTDTVDDYAESFDAYKLYRMWWQNKVKTDELTYDVTEVTNIDLDAQAIITAMGETDPDRERAVNVFVRAQKRDGLWKNCEYMAIFHNDTWAKCALEWRNLSATLTKVGNCFSALNGVTGTLSGYVDSGFIPSAATKITQNSAELIVFAKYLTATGTNEGVLAGCQDTSGDGFTIDCSGTSGNINYAINSTTSASTAAGVRDNGLIVAKRVDNNSVRLYTRDYQQHADNSTNSTGLSTRPVYVGARNNDGVADKFTPATVAAMFVYPELSDAKHTKLLRNLQTYMTAVY